jgi:2-amino-4-hydroxy-6-hydroxymethyldihydropteridine diphosphokinase
VTGQDSSPKPQTEAWAYIALGSNIGDPRQNILEVISRLEKLSTIPLAKSSLWQTTPVDCPPGSPPFVNAAAGLCPLPSETPESLLRKLQALEREFGRKPKQVLNEPRSLDLDLIAFGNEVRETSELILPHPRAHQRRFVLAPLAEIAPQLVLPGQTETVTQLLGGLTDDEAQTVTKLTS